MALSMKVCGITIYIMEGESFTMLVAIFMKANLLMIWLRDLESINMQMEVNTLVIGVRISNMVLERKNGTMAANIKDFTKMLPKKVKENIAGLMATGMLENGSSIC